MKAQYKLNNPDGTLGILSVSARETEIEKLIRAFELQGVEVTLVSAKEAARIRRQMAIEALR